MSDHGGEGVMDSYIDLFLAGNNIPHRRFFGWYGMVWNGNPRTGWLTFYRNRNSSKKQDPVFCAKLWDNGKDNVDSKSLG